MKMTALVVLLFAAPALAAVEEEALVEKVVVKNRLFTVQQVDNSSSS